MKHARRTLLCLAAMAATSLATPAARAADAARMLEPRRVISQQPRYFHGWPTVARRRDGVIVLVYSGGREGHICPFGRLEMMTSRDEGLNWTFPRTILDTDLDDRDAGVVETPTGALLVTTFTADSMERLRFLEEKIAEGKASADRVAGWKEAISRVSDEQRKKMLGAWLIRSSDQGLTWSPPLPAVVSSPHGPIVLRDGRLLHLGKEMGPGTKGRIGACESTDDGLTWKWLAEIPTRPGDDFVQDYHELHAVEADDGRIVAQIRHEGKTDNHETLQSESDDGGRTWSRPHTIGVWGYPSHLLKLRGGGLLMTYGYRRAPGRGNQARISRDGGRTWSQPLVISADSNADHGYPSSVELSDGSFLTVWYDRSDLDKAVLRQVRWKLADTAEGG